MFFAGDASYSEALMVDQAIDGVAPDARSAKETLRRIRELTRERPLVYLPSHDPEAAKRLDARQIVTAEVSQGAPATHEHINEKSARSEPTA